MSDIFDISGEGTETPSAEVPAEQSAETPTVSNEGAAPDPSTVEETPQGDEGQEAPATTTDEAKPPTEDEIAELEKEVETALADERTPKWFKNAVENVYKPKLASLTEQIGTYEPLAQFGAVDEISEKLTLLNDLNTVRSNPRTGMPEQTTEPFVQKLYEKDPKVTYQLLNDLAQLPSPYTQGYTVVQEMLKEIGIDPTRLDDVKTFAANGYLLQAGQYPAPDAEELAEIPKHLQATYAALSPERRDALMIQEDAVRDANLEDARLAAEAQREKTLRTQSEADEKASQERTQQEQFKSQVDTKGFEHFTKSGETVFTSFVDSLAKQANMTQMDSLMIANTVMNSFEPTVQGRLSLEALKADGITVDPAIPQTIIQLEENGKHIAYYEVTGDRANMERAVAKQVELQERLIAKSNKIIATLAQKRAQNTATAIQTQNSALDITQSQRYATAGVGAQIGAGNGQVNDDFNDESYIADLRASGYNGRK